jgi:hypothetical protein
MMVSYETVRHWVNHFGPMIAADLADVDPNHITTCHLDGVSRTQLLLRPVSNHYKLRS